MIDFNQFQKNDFKRGFKCLRRHWLCQKKWKKYVRSLYVNHIVQSITFFSDLHYHLFYARQVEIDSHLLPPSETGNIPFNPIIKVLFGKVNFSSGIIYCLQLATVDIWTKGNFVYTGVMKNQHLILYSNLYWAPSKWVVFLIVAVLFIIQWYAQIFVKVF